MKRILIPDRVCGEYFRNMDRLTSGKEHDHSASAAADSVATAPAAAAAASREAGPSKKDDNSASIAVEDSSAAQTRAVTSSAVESNPSDPLNFGRHRRDNVTQRQMQIDHPNGDKKQLKKFYTRQNELIDQFLGADDEERLQVEEDARVAPKIKFAVNASFTVNFCLFVIQLYAAVSTGSLSVNDPGRENPHIVNLVDHIDSSSPLLLMPLCVKPLDLAANEVLLVNIKDRWTSFRRL